MNDQEKKATQEETPKDQKIELTDDEVEAAAGGFKLNAARKIDSLKKNWK